MHEGRAETALQVVGVIESLQRGSTQNGQHTFVVALSVDQVAAPWAVEDNRSRRFVLDGGDRLTTRRQTRQLADG